MLPAIRIERVTQTTITVFIENEAGTDIKNHHNEVTLEHLGTERVGATYPYPYGFVPGTLAPDDDAADCFVISAARLETGKLIECRPVALLEQTEGGVTDHHVIAVPSGDEDPDLHLVRTEIARFMEGFMAGVAERKSVPGRMLPADAAAAYLAECAEAAKGR